MDGIS